MSLLAFTSYCCNRSGVFEGFLVVHINLFVDFTSPIASFGVKFHFNA